MAEGSFVDAITPNIASGGFLDLVVWLSLGAVTLLIIGGWLYYLFRRKKNYNLKVEFRLPRDVSYTYNDRGERVVSGSIQKEWGKGFYDKKTGAVWLKRKGVADVPMKPFNLKEYLSGKILTVIQIGIEDYRPVKEDSYLNISDMTGKEHALINAKIDTTESKSWRTQFERQMKDAFTISSWFRENGQLVGFAFIIMVIFVGFAIIYGRVS